MKFKSDLKDRLYSMFSSATTVIWTAIVAVIMLLLWFFHSSTQYTCKANFVLSNILLCVIAIATLSSLCALYVFKKEKTDKFFKGITFKHIAIASAFFLAVQLFVFYNIYFKTDWDVRAIFQAAEAIASNVEHTEAQDWYYLRCPNNLLMTWIFSVIIRVCNLIGLTGEFSHIFAIIILQCILFAISSIILFKLVQSIIPNPVIPFAAWLLFWMNVGFNPYLTIPYSDSMTLIFPIAILYIYRTTENGRYLTVKWPLITVLAILGYMIKPQVIIILIAILGYELIKFILKYDTKRKIASGIGCCVGVLALLLTSLISNFAFSRLPIRLDDEAAFGFQHYLMMGFNEENGGVYWDSDVQFSMSFKTAKERNAANIRVFKERVKNMGFAGLTKFLAKKAMTNFGNGTYAWGVEGVFYYEVPEEKNSTISPFLRSYFYSYGENYPAFATFQQYLWLIILMGNLGIVFIIKDKKMRSTMTVPTLALIGLTMFEMIFEARARYLFNYSPIFILTAAVGWYAILKKAIPLINKLKENKDE